MFYAVCAAYMYIMWYTACSSDGMREVARVLFSNTECLNRFGTARPLAANAELIQRMPITTRTAWKDWYQQFCQVSTCRSILMVVLFHALWSA